MVNPSTVEGPSLRQDLAMVLRDFARTMATEFPIQAILDELVSQIVRMLPITAAGVTLISADLHPRYIAASDHMAAEFEQLQAALVQGPCLEAYQTEQTVASADLRLEERFREFARQAVESGLLAVFAIPLRHGDSLLGALDL